MDTLTHLIAKAVDNGDWYPLKTGRTGPAISRLMLATDLLLLGKATKDIMNVLKNTLNMFCSLSRQLVSLVKTSILFSKIKSFDWLSSVLE